MVKTLGDFCIIRVLADDEQTVPAVALYYYDPTDTEALFFIQTLVARAPLRLDEPSIDQHVFQTGAALLVPSVDLTQLHARIKPEYRVGIERFQPHSMIVVALKVQKRAIGLLGLYRSRSQLPAFTEDDLTLAQDLADRAALAIHNARLLQQVQGELAERKAAEQALEAERALLARRVAERTADLSLANAELARSARLKDEFLASMSHELRTPLNSILGRSQALQEQIYGPLVPKQVEVLQGVEESGRHLLSLINDILDLSKIEAGKLDMEVEPINVDLLCRLSVRMVAQTALQKRISLTSTADSMVDTIEADERRLKQILVNLLSNAVKFTPKGGKVGLEVHGDVARQAATFTVWDTGIGIAEDDLPKLFKPFLQIDSSLSRQYEGTGLGLALVRRLAEAHGGSVALESTPGQGSRFSVTLPWKPAPASPASLPDTAVIDTDKPTVHNALVIEDSSSAAERIAHFLSELGARVEVYPQGGGAVEQAIALRPDVIVLDILLPDLIGWEVLKELKAEPRTQAIPVVIVTVVDEPERARALGAAAFLLKPIDRQTLHQTLRQVLQAKAELPVQTALVIAPRAERPRLLLAEDNEPSIELLEYYLQAKGYEVVVARNGGEALLRTQESPPHVILMDIQMPGMDGLEAIRRIRADADLRAIPIIAVTALAMPGDRERCLHAGADEYLTKPVALPGLLATIESQLKGRRQ
jgi:signal transduction histidine kinase/DNA-binding response OmpR family regulator